MGKRNSKKIMELYGLVDIVKSQRLRWLGHNRRLDYDRVVKKVFNGVLSEKEEDQRRSGLVV